MELAAMELLGMEAVLRARAEQLALNVNNALKLVHMDQIAKEDARIPALLMENVTLDHLEPEDAFPARKVTLERIVKSVLLLERLLISGVSLPFLSFYLV
jgi:hypothetical protein